MQMIIIITVTTITARYITISIDDLRYLTGLDMNRIIVNIDHCVAILLIAVAILLIAVVIILSISHMYVI